MKYAWIEQHKDSLSVKVMCEALGASKSAYYAWRKRTPGPRELRSQRIRDSVRQVHEESNQIYGSYKIADELAKDPKMETACRNTVAKAMREMKLKSRVSKRFKPTTTINDPSKKPADNILNQVFEADGPNQKWVTDITYLPLVSGFVYLAVVLDLFSRKVVGWELSDSLATPLVSDALRNAIEKRMPETSNLLLHSDRGCQYTSDEYQTALRTMNITCSMSRTGCCYDNAVVERFFWSLKHEWTKFESFENMDQVRASVFKYIETFYNLKRIHQSLEYLSPEQFEKKHAQTLAA
ncbi:IS3 family transposase [Mariniblastus sp.]|nr:IS3 family transposase [Mariniblastus sp.]